SEIYKPTILGVSAEFMAETFNIYPDKGVLFSEEDNRNRANVAVIGHKVKEELFGDSDAVGEFITVKNRKFRVVGVLPKKGQVSFFNMDTIVMIPPSTAQVYLLGINYHQEIIVKTDTPENVPKMVSD